MDERTRRHIEYMEREFPHDPTKHVEPPELTELDKRRLDDAWAVVEEDRRRKSRDGEGGDA
jgi:hypothetical protein